MLSNSSTHKIAAPAIVLILLAGANLTPRIASAAGLESSGNTDGILTWDLGTIAPGKSGGQTVIFAYADSYENLTGLLARARKHLQANPPLPPSTHAAARTRITWVKNPTTDLALDEYGSFFWESHRQSLTSPRGGQLSRFGYYIHYNDPTAKQAGISITNKSSRENLRLIEPVRAIGSEQAVGVLETADKKLKLTIRGLVGRGAFAAVEFTLANISAEPVSNVRLSVYSNLESAHDHANDYSMLDQATGALLVIDPPTGICTAMAGLTKPAAGYSGLWSSQAQLQSANGIGIDRWKPFADSKDRMQQLKKKAARASIPHPPAPFKEPTEPETRTLTQVEADNLLEDDWLFQAKGTPLGRRAGAEIAWAIQLAERLAVGAAPPDLRDELAILAQLQNRLDRLTENDNDIDADTAKEMYLDVRRVKRRIMFRNPLIDFTGVLFIDNPYPQGAEWPHQARHRDGMMAVPGGRLLALDGLHPGGNVRKLAPDNPGSFWRPDISFDGEQVLFCFKGHDEKSFHLYQINIDGTGLRQLTFGDYDDLDPIYLPDGHIVFSTTRANTYIRCMPYTYCYVLARCDADGGNIYLISRNNETDWLPTLLNDGRIIYSRWEYHDKALWRIQSLWTVNQDGTNTVAFWGNQSVWPDHLAEARPIPNSRRVMFTGTAHHNWFAGSIGIIDPRKGFNFPHGLTKVTADVAWPECGKPPVDPPESKLYHRSGSYDAYKTPYPLSEEDFLVSARRNGKFRLYLMDVYGNRELIYEGAHHIFHALPVKARKRPPVHNDRVAWPGTGEDRTEPECGILFSPNIYQGLDDLPRGKAKYLRVIQMDYRTYSSWTRDARFSGPAVSLIQDDGVKRILGTVPVDPDGSVHFEVPAGKTLHFQVLDEHYRALQTMRSFSGVMPGERRGCIGCHEIHSTAVPNKTATALRRRASELTPPPWGTKSISYERFVQPVLDEHCGDCHQGDGKARAKLDLTLRPGFRFFKEPYPTLVGYANYSNAKRTARPGIAGAIMAENFGQSDPDSYLTFPPMKHLSYTSRLIEIAMSGKHNDVKVDALGLRKLIAWVDANCPYRGEEDIRALPDPRFAGIEALPIRPRIKTAPIIPRP